jgi:hypothetical protein
VGGEGAEGQEGGQRQGRDEAGRGARATGVGAGAPPRSTAASLRFAAARRGPRRTPRRPVPCR